MRKPPRRNQKSDLIVHSPYIDKAAAPDTGCRGLLLLVCPLSGILASLILFSLKTIALPRAEISRLRVRPKGFPIIVAPLSTSAFGGLATDEPSPFGNLRGCPLVPMFLSVREETIQTNEQGQPIRYIIRERPASLKKRYSGADYDKALEAAHAKSSVRCKVEHVFAVVKGMFHFRKTQWRGLTRLDAQLHMRFALANLVLAARPSLAV